MNSTNSILIETIIFLTFYFVFVLIIIIISAYISDKITKYFVGKRLSKGKYLIIFIATICIIPVTIFVNTMIDYRQMNLDEVVRLNEDEFEYLVINHDYITDRKEHIQELNELLNKYRVKKSKEQTTSPDSEKQYYNVTVYVKGKPKIVLISENFINFVNNGHFYEVLNGPIDMSWFEEILNE